MKYGLSLILACYNEEPHLISSYKKVLKKLKECKLPYEIIFVEDRSTDNTAKIIKFIIKNNNLTNAIFHKKNVGRGGAVTDGIFEAKYEYVGFIDIDLEISEDYINLFINELKRSADMAIASRSYIFQLKSLHRIILSKGYVFLKKFFLDIPLQDTEAGYKFFKKSKILPVLKLIKDKGWFWDTEIVARSYLNDLSIKEIPVTFIRRRDKKSTVKIFKDSFYYFQKLFSFKKEVNLHRFPTLSLLFCYKNSLKGTIFALLKSLLFPLREIKELLPKKGLIIDAGCAEGIVSNYLSLANPFIRVIGVDRSNSKITMARKTISGRKNINFIKYDIMNFNFLKCQAIIASDFLHHLSIKDQNSLIERVFKSLEKNGTFLIKEVDNSSGIRKLLSRLWDFILYPHDEINYRKVKAWETHLRKIGFTVNSKKASYFSPFSTVLILAKKL